MSTAALAFGLLLAVLWIALTLTAVGQSLTRGARDWRHDHRRRR